MVAVARRRSVGRSLARAVVVGGVLTLTGTALQVSASAEPASYSSWTARVDGVSSVDDEVTSWVETADSEVVVNAWRYDDDGGVGAVAYGPGASGINLFFVPPKGQRTTAGTTYTVGSFPATESTGQLRVLRDGRMCGRTEDRLPRDDGWTPDLAKGTIDITELERDDLGNVVRFAATYELNCQVVGESPGIAGSVASDATAPASDPPVASVPPAPVTALRATNKGRTSSETNVTTITWTDPVENFGDTVVETGFDESGFPAPIGGANDHVRFSTDGRFVDEEAFGTVSRLFRVTPRGPSGRLGRSSFLVVRGTHFEFGERATRSAVGQPVRLTGRLREAWVGDGRKGAAVAGKRVEVCVQYSGQFDGQVCPAIAADRTDEDGRFAFTLTPERNGIYTVRINATSRMLGNVGALVRAEVTPHTDLRVKQDPAARSHKVTFTTSRARTGSVGQVRLQRKVGTTWRTVTTRMLTGTHRGRLVIAVKVPSGKQQYRVVKPADRRHTTGVSRVVRVG